MNVDDVTVEVPEGDLLETMFQAQWDHLTAYSQIERRRGLGLGLLNSTPGVRPLDLDSPEAQYVIKDFCWRIVEELGEAANCLKNKPWKVSMMETDQNHFFEEIIDAVHFFLELLILLGFDAKSLASLYLKKTTVNQFRQKSNY